jgi:plasmid segregation protein ParM
MIKYKSVRENKEEYEMVAKRKKKYDRVIGIDLGNGLVKVRSVTKEGRLYSLILPSCFAYLKDVGESMNHSSLDIDVYTIDDVQYVWGEDITRVGNLIYTYGHENRYKTEAYKLMAKIVIARIVRDLEIEANEKILIVTGVPSIETGTECEEDIANAFYGEDNGFHEVGVNDEEYTFRIAHVHVTSQALATVIGRYLDEDGSVLDEEYETMKVAVIDIGAGTTDLDIVHELRRQKAYHSVPKGFRDVYESIRAEIRKKYPSHDVHDYEFLKIIENVQEEIKKKGDKAKVKYEYKPSKLKESVDFTKALNDGIKEVVISIQQAIMSKWKNQTDLDEILLVGGSAELFKDYLESIVEGFTIPTNNGDSNVEGYFRLGMALLEGDE